MLSEPRTRDFSLLPDNRLEVTCMLKGGVIASEICVRAQLEGCFCRESGFGALKGLEKFLATRVPTDDEEKRLRARQATELLSLKARAAGFIKKPEAEQYAGPALSMRNSGRRGVVAASAQRVQVATPRLAMEEQDAKRSQDLAGKFHPKCTGCGAGITEQNRDGLCWNCRPKTAAAPRVEAQPEEQEEEDVDERFCARTTCSFWVPLSGDPVCESCREKDAKMMAASVPPYAPEEPSSQAAAGPKTIGERVEAMADRRQAALKPRARNLSDDQFRSEWEKAGNSHGAFGRKFGGDFYAIRKRAKALGLTCLSPGMPGRRREPSETPPKMTEASSVPPDRTPIALSSEETFAAVKEHGGIQQAARALGVSRDTIHRRLDEAGLRETALSPLSSLISRLERERDVVQQDLTALNLAIAVLYRHAREGAAA